MKSRFLTVQFMLASGLVLFSSCGSIKSQDAYDKSPLSGFVANQTTALIKKNAAPKEDNTALEKTVENHTEKIKVLDANSQQAKEVISGLEKKLNEIEAIEKEQAMEFERSNSSVVFFELGSSQLSTSGMQELYRWKSALDQGATHYNYSVSIFASADKSGDKRINDKLRKERANAVKNFIVNVLGIKSAVNVVTEQPAFSKVNDVDRRVVLTVNVNN